jgi:hypothetical protein
MATVSLLDVNSQLYLVDMAVRIERRSFPKNEVIAECQQCVTVPYRQ